MTDPNAADTPIESLGDLPIQPTGSGVADLEIAYEQMRLADDAADQSAAATTAVDEPVADAKLTTPEDAAESAAHPS